MILRPPISTFFLFFFFTDPATTEIYTLSLHDALPISKSDSMASELIGRPTWSRPSVLAVRSEEHTSELQSRSDLVCRLLLEKKEKAAEKRIVAFGVMDIDTHGLVPAISEAIKLRIEGVFFFFNDTATTEIYTLSLHDALPI